MDRQTAVGHRCRLPGRVVPVPAVAEFEQGVDEASGDLPGPDVVAVDGPSGVGDAVVLAAAALGLVAPVGLDEAVLEQAAVARVERRLLDLVGAAGGIPDRLVDLEAVALVPRRPPTRSCRCARAGGRRRTWPRIRPPLSVSCPRTARSRSTRRWTCPSRAADPRADPGGTGVRAGRSGDAGIVVRDDEAAALEVSDFGLGDLARTGPADPRVRQHRPRLRQGARMMPGQICPSTCTSGVGRRARQGGDLPGADRAR